MHCPQQHTQLLWAANAKVISLATTHTSSIDTRTSYSLPATASGLVQAVKPGQQGYDVQILRDNKQTQVCRYTIYIPT